MAKQVTPSTQQFALDPREYAKQYALAHGKPRRDYLRKCKEELEEYVREHFTYGGKPVSLAEVFTVRATEPNGS